MKWKIKKKIITDINYFENLLRPLLLIQSLGVCIQHPLQSMVCNKARLLYHIPEMIFNNLNRLWKFILRIYLKWASK